MYQCVLVKIEAERERQARKGFGPDHDDRHGRGELALAGAVIVMRAVWAASAATLLRMPNWVGDLIAKVESKYGESIERRMIVGVAMIIADLERRARLANVENADLSQLNESPDWFSSDGQYLMKHHDGNTPRKRLVAIRRTVLARYVAGHSIADELVRAGLPRDCKIVSISFLPAHQIGDDFIVQVTHPSFLAIPVGMEYPTHAGVVGKSRGQ